MLFFIAFFKADVDDVRSSICTVPENLGMKGGIAILRDDRRPSRRPCHLAPSISQSSFTTCVSFAMMLSVYRSGQDTIAIFIAALGKAQHATDGCDITASPLGLRRASKSSSTRGKPLVISRTSAVPPLWKVRSVNCVPGSPIDCAAMMPTAAPIFTISPVPKIAPVAQARRRHESNRRSAGCAPRPLPALEFNRCAPRFLHRSFHCAQRSIHRFRDRLMSCAEQRPTMRSSMF